MPKWSFSLSFRQECVFLRRFIMNESGLCYRRMYVCLDVRMDGCNEMYCDETTKATNIPFGAIKPLDNRNRSAKRQRKIPPFWPPAAILNFLRPTFENATTFEPFEISTPEWRHFAQD
jgi:hypothetical protein